MFESIAAFFFVIGLCFVFALVETWIVWLLLNWLVPLLGFSGWHIDFWPVLGLLVLLNVVGSAFKK